jgi:hypothetical protein
MIEKLARANRRALADIEDEAMRIGPDLLDVDQVGDQPRRSVRMEGTASPKPGRGRLLDRIRQHRDRTSPGGQT